MTSQENDLDKNFLGLVKKLVKVLKKPLMGKRKTEDRFYDNISMN